MGLSNCTALVLFAGLLAASIVDARSLRIPNPLVAVIALTGLVLAMRTLDLQDAAVRVAVIIGFLILCMGLAEFGRVRTGTIQIGGGDLKLLAALALWVGPMAMLPILLISSTTALAATLARTHIQGPAFRNARIPFAPYIFGGTVAVWFGEFVSGGSWHQLVTF